MNLKLINFDCKIFIKSPKDFIVLIDSRLHIHESLFEFDYLRHAATVQVLQVIVLCKTLQASPDALSIFFCHSSVDVCLLHSSDLWSKITKLLIKFILVLANLVKFERRVLLHYFHAWFKWFHGSLERFNAYPIVYSSIEFLGQDLKALEHVVVDGEAWLLFLLVF